MTIFYFIIYRLFSVEWSSSISSSIDCLALNDALLFHPPQVRTDDPQRGSGRPGERRSDREAVRDLSRDRRLHGHQIPVSTEDLSYKRWPMFRLPRLKIEVKNTEIRYLPDLSIFNLLSVYVLVPRIFNYYPNYLSHCLYFREVGTPYGLKSSPPIY